MVLTQKILLVRQKCNLVVKDIYIYIFIQKSQGSQATKDAFPDSIWRRLEMLPQYSEFTQTYNLGEYLFNNNPVGSYEISLIFDPYGTDDPQSPPAFTPK